MDYENGNNFLQANGYFYQFLCLHDFFYPKLKE